MPDHESTALDQALLERLAALPERRRSLFAALRDERARTGRPQPAELLRPGSGDPVILLHPLGGQVLGYAALVRELATTRPVLALPAEAALAGPAEPVLEEIAARYLDRVLATGLTPSVFAGWSFGGVLAYELARQYSTRFEPRTALLIDAAPAPPHFRGTMPGNAELNQGFVDDLLASGGHPSYLGRLPQELGEAPTRTVMTELLARLARAGLVLHLGADELVGLHQIYVNCLRALSGYTPDRADFPVHFLRADQWPDDLSELWRPAVPDDLLTVSTLPADHYSLLRPPVVVQVAKLLDRL